METCFDPVSVELPANYRQKVQQSVWIHNQIVIHKEHEALRGNKQLGSALFRENETSNKVDGLYVKKNVAIAWQQEHES